MYAFEWHGLTGNAYRGTAIAVAPTEEQARSQLVTCHTDLTGDDVRVLLGPPTEVHEAEGYHVIVWSE